MFHKAHFITTYLYLPIYCYIFTTVYDLVKVAETNNISPMQEGVKMLLRAIHACLQVHRPLGSE